jgi:hypothetical protein
MIKRLSLFFLDFYQKALRPLLPSSCIFQPSCSEYTEQAISKYGAAKGLFKGLKRLLLCHPFSGRQGYHPLK